MEELDFGLKELLKKSSDILKNEIEGIITQGEIMENKKELSRKEIEKLRKIIKEYDKKNKSEYKERLERGKKYFGITSGGGICINVDDYYEADDNYFEIGNYYFTKEEAEKELEKMKIRTKLKRLAERLNFEITGKKQITEEDWKNEEIKKVVIVYDFRDDVINDDSNRIYKRGDIYCLDNNFLAKAIEEIGEEELKELFK